MTARPSIGRLVLVRHGQSTFNAENRFTGRLDPDLTTRGVSEALEAAGKIGALGYEVDAVFTSCLTRTVRSARIILDALGSKVTPVATAAFNERDYGALTGLNKAEAAARFGEAQIHGWRRSFKDGPPRGESLRDTLARVAPSYIRDILPALLQGETVLIVSHGNTLRALVTLLEGLSPAEAEALEIATGELLVFEVDAEARICQSALNRTLVPQPSAPF